MCLPSAPGIGPYGGLLRWIKPGRARCTGAMIMVIVADVVAAAVALRSAPRFGGTGYHAGGFGIMTQLPQSAAFGRSTWKLVVGLLIRVTISATVLFAAYYLVPTKSSGEHSDLPWLILELAIFG